MLYCFFVCWHWNQESWLEGQNSGFRNRAIKHSLNTRQLILGYRGSTKNYKTIGTPPCTLRQPWVSVPTRTVLKGLSYHCQVTTKTHTRHTLSWPHNPQVLILGPASRSVSQTVRQICSYYKMSDITLGTTYVQSDTIVGPFLVPGNNNCQHRASAGRQTSTDRDR